MIMMTKLMYLIPIFRGSKMYRFYVSNFEVLYVKLRLSWQQARDGLPLTLCLLPIHLKCSGNYMYRQFIIQQFYVLSTQCIYVFCVDLRTNSHYFSIQH